MYKNQFDKELTANIVYNAYMFYGQCDYLVQDYSDQVSKKLANGDDINKVYFDEYNFKECVNYLSQSSLFSSNNILLIKTIKKIPKKEVDELISICNTNSDSSIIFSCVGETDFKTMAKSFTKKTSSVEVRFFTPNDQEALHILNKELQNHNLQCGFGELQYLYNMHQKDLTLCVNDLNKLAILEEPISVNVINAQCFGMGGVNLDDFFNKLFTAQAINRDLYMLLEEGMNEINLINQTTSFIQQLFNINTYLKLNGQLNIVEIWGYKLPQNIANTRASIAMRFKQEQFLEMLNFFQTLELELKTKNTLDTNSYTQAQFRNFSANLR
ncbi:MAG: DNA polymerase III subunit delta [Campylobacterota bacterium]|nr:DNA polymerase III subunit delta [Campylobacterota bacterium]